MALFESVQETRQLSLQISRQLDDLDGRLATDLPNMIKRIMRDANTAEIDATIERLRVEEEFVALPWGRDLVREGGARRVCVEGMECYLVGREFPVAVACLGGIGVEANWREEKVS